MTLFSLFWLDTLVVWLNVPFHCSVYWYGPHLNIYAMVPLLLLCVRLLVLIDVGWYLVVLLLI